MDIRYEKKTDDFYYRDDNNHKTPLQCSAHLHYHIEIVYMRKGKMQAYIDSEPHLLSDGEMLVVFPNKIHRFVDLTEAPEYDLFILNPDITPELSSKIANEEPESPIIKDVFKNERLISLIKSLSGAKSFPKNYRETLIRGYVLAFFSEILEMTSLRSIKNEDHQSLKVIVQFCSQHFTGEISLPTLEKELHLSRYYISHLFSDKIGIRFNDYINSLRISEACRLLRTTDLNITEVSSNAGFSTLRTFNRAFIKQMGVSPSDYKKGSKNEHLSVPLQEM